MPEQNLSDFARKVVAAQEKLRPRHDFEYEVAGERPDLGLYPEFDNQVTSGHFTDEHVKTDAYRKQMEALKRGTRNDVRYDISGSPVPEDPFKTVSLPGVETGDKAGKAIGEYVRPFVPSGLRELASKAVAGYGNWARSLAPAKDTTVFSEHVSAPVYGLGDKLERMARDLSPGYKYDRSVQEYVKMLEKSGGIAKDGGELD